MTERRRRRWPLWLAGALVAFAVGLGSAWMWLTERVEVPASSNYRVDLDELRALASQLPGAKPERVSSEPVAETTLPRAALFAGESFAPHPMLHQVFQVRWTDGQSLIIDTAFPPERLEHVGGGTADAAAWGRVLRAMRSARQIIVTHEHFDHLAGASKLKVSDGVGERLQLTGKQLGNSAALDEAGFSQEARKALTPLVFDRTLAIAPGVVLQKAGGHTPGSLFVFVQLLDGRELLFIGDTAWHLDQIRNLHYRPRLVTQFFLNEDRDAVLAQFRTLHELMKTTPDLAIVVSHDRDQRQRLVDAGMLHDGLRQ